MELKSGVVCGSSFKSKSELKLHQDEHTNSIRDEKIKHLQKLKIELEKYEPPTESKPVKKTVKPDKSKKVILKRKFDEICSGTIIKTPGLKRSCSSIYRKNKEEENGKTLIMEKHTYKTEPVTEPIVKVTHEPEIIIKEEPQEIIIKKEPPSPDSTTPNEAITEEMKKFCADESNRAAALESNTDFKMPDGLTKVEGKLMDNSKMIYFGK